MSAGDSGDFTVERVGHIYAQIPTLIASALMGVFLVFVLLHEAVGGPALMAWLAYMLSVLAVRAWLWHAHRNAAPTARSARHWEYANAAGALLSGIGWGLLAGPLYPAGQVTPSHFVMLLLAAVAFGGAIYNSLSPLSFVVMLVPTLVPIAARLALEAKTSFDGPTLGVAMLFGVLLMLQRSQYRLVMENLQRRIESETLLEEQEAMFQSASHGIAIIRGDHIVKCNQRLGEMLGRRLQDVYAQPFAAHCATRGEFERLLEDGRQAFGHGRNHHGIIRLRRADGSQFWAELSGRRMRGGDGSSVWLIADVTLKQDAAGGQR